MSGLISIKSESLVTANENNLVVMSINSATALFFRPRLSAIVDNSVSFNPSLGSIVYLIIFSGDTSATVSISIPPSEDPINVQDSCALSMSKLK